LPTDAGKLLVPDPPGNRPERRFRLDGLELLGIADQDHLGPVFRGGAASTN